MGSSSSNHSSETNIEVDVDADVDAELNSHKRHITAIQQQSNVKSIREEILYIGISSNGAI